MILEGVFILMACFLTWFCTRVRDLLVAFSASLTWLGLAMWIFFSTVSAIPLGEVYSKILVWVFFMMTFVPWVLQANYEVKHESKNGQWSEWGEKPKEEYPDTLDSYKKTLRKRWGRR